MPDPEGSVYYDFFKKGKFEEDKGCTYFVEGIGEDHICEALDLGLVDEMYRFSDKEVFATARRMAKEEGILVGGSSGANVWGAIELAKKIEGPAVIVTVCPDSGIKYLSKIYNDDWMREKGLLE
jgi:cystathionine beta-synthase/cysteine synthase A